MPRPITPAAAVRHFASRFRAIGSRARATGEKAYMKSALRFHGITAKQLRDEAKAFCAAHPELDRAAMRSIADALFATEWFDLRSVAIALLERKTSLLVAGDAAWLAELARCGACWAHVDYVVTRVIGPVLETDPKRAAKIRRWAKDDDFWVRRVALLAELRPLRRGSGDFALFASIAAPMLDEKEFFIRKAIGWVLREVSKKRPVLVRDFLVAHGARVSGVTWREAAKYLPASMQKEVGPSPSARRARLRP